MTANAPVRDQPWDPGLTRREDHEVPESWKGSLPIATACCLNHRVERSDSAEHAGKVDIDPCFDQRCADQPERALAPLVGELALNVLQHVGPMADAHIG